MTIENHLQTVVSLSNRRTDYVDCKQVKIKTSGLVGTFYKLHHSRWKSWSHPFTIIFRKDDFLFSFSFSVYSKELTIHTLSSCCQHIIRYLIQSVSTVPGTLQVLTFFTNQENGFLFPPSLCLDSWIVAPLTIIHRSHILMNTFLDIIFTT